MRKSIILPAACLLQQAFAKYSVHVTYSPNLVTVGDADIFGLTWTEIYAAQGNQNAVVLQPSKSSRADACKEGGRSQDTTVSADIEGQWGRDPGLGAHDSREAIVQAYWDFMKVFMADNQYRLWAECVHVNGRNALTPWWPTASACTGGGCAGCSGTSGLECQYGDTGFRVPAKVKVTMTNAQGQLMSDGLTISFSSTQSGGNGGCGLAGAIAGQLAGLIPGAGQYINAGISVACA